MGTGEQQAKQTAGAADPVWQQYGQWLQRYLARCLRHHDAASAQDLAQEVYLRLLRVDKGEPVRNWQAYLYRIASHVVYEFKMRARQEIVSFDSEAVENWEEQTPAGASDPAGERFECAAPDRARAGSTAAARAYRAAAAEARRTRIRRDCARARSVDQHGAQAFDARTGCLARRPVGSLEEPRKANPP